MPKAESQPDGIDTPMSGIVAAARGSQDEAVRAWARGCELYADYFAALAKAKGPEGLLAANADLLTGTMEAIVQSAASARRFNGAATASPGS